METDNDATQCYLFFQRMAAKADLINSTIAQSHGLPEALNGRVTEGLVRTCEVIYICLWHLLLSDRTIQVES